MARRNVEMLIIDPQNDFLDIPDNELPISFADVIAMTGGASVPVFPTPLARPSLPVPGATADMKRLAAFIEANLYRINDIHVTLDSHHNLDVAHPMFWKDAKGNHPAPFTMISKDDVINGVWRPFAPNMKDAVYGTLQNRMINYVTTLEANGRYALIIWPPHCLIGTWGTQVYHGLIHVFHRWEREREGMIDFVTKGSNLFTEHYSGVQADVPDPQDPSTQLNTRLIETLERADDILTSGEALSHCLKFTVGDIADAFSADAVSKFVLLTDCTSSVAGFEADGQAFIADMVKRGMRTSTTADYRF